MDRRNMSLENFHGPSQESNAEAPVLWRSTSTNCATACPLSFIPCSHLVHVVVGVVIIVVAVVVGEGGEGGGGGGSSSSSSSSSVLGEFNSPCIFPHSFGW